MRQYRRLYFLRTTLDIGKGSFSYFGPKLLTTSLEVQRNLRCVIFLGKVILFINPQLDGDFTTGHRESSILIKRQKEFWFLVEISILGYPKLKKCIFSKCMYTRKSIANFSIQPIKTKTI